MATPIKWGSDFLVNTTTSFSQREPALTALADGRFVAVWTDPSQSSDDTEGQAVRAQVFNADGTPYGAEFLVNTTTARTQSAPALTALADGRFVAAWEDQSQSGGDTNGVAVRAQIFNANGSKSGTEFLVNSTSTSFQLNPALTALTNGQFVVAWTDLSRSVDDPSNEAVRAQVFNADGSKSGSEFLINTTTNDRQERPTLTALADGRFVAAWTDFSQSGGDTSNTAVRAQIFNLDGGKSGEEFLVNTTTINDQAVPKITALSGGGFVAVWLDASLSGGDTSGTAVHAQVFNDDGNKIGSEFLVNTTTLEFQYAPALIALVDGRFVAAWADGSLSVDDPSGSAVRAQVFNSDGSKSGAEFLVNTTTNSNQYQPTLSVLADGRFVVAWTDDDTSGGDTSASSVRAQIFDPRESAINLSGSTLGDDFVGTQWADTISGGLGEDQIKGADGDDWLNGGAQNDTLWGDAGNDTLIGGNGDDTYYLDSTSDVVIENVGGGNDTVVSAWLSLTLASFPRVENAQLSGTLDLNLTGNAGKNTLTGNAGANLILGLGGDDTISAFAGNDTIYGNAGNDLIEGGTGNDSLYGGIHRDRLDGGIGNDTLNGGGGSDTLIGGTGHDVYYIDSTTDQVIENALEDIDTLITGVISLNLSRYAFVENALLVGALGLNLTGNAGNNTLTANAGANLIQGMGGDDTISSFAGNDTIYGGAGTDLIEGGTGNDTLSGGTEMDTLFGGTGKDRLIGGADADVFAFRTKAEAGNGVNRDVIADFAVSVDRIDLSAIDANELLEGNQAFSFIGSAAFSGAPGELRYGSAAGFVYADTNGDSIADFQLQLIGKPVIAAADFEL